MAINQLYLFLIYVATGIIITIIFDIFRSIRKSMRTGNKITTIEDVIFWIIISIIIIFEILYFNYGELRLYILLGLITGSAIYLITASKYVIKVNTKIFTGIKKLILKIMKILSKIIKLLIIPIQYIIKKCKRMKDFWIFCRNII